MKYRLCSNCKDEVERYLANHMKPSMTNTELYLVMKRIKKNVDLLNEDLERLSFQELVSK